MLRKISIRWRLTILSALLLTVCCIGLTIVLNYSAFLLADTLEAAVPTMPAMEIIPNTNSLPMQEMAPSIPYENLQAAKQGFSDQSLLYMLLIIIGGSALTYYISGRALKPLDLLNKQVKNLTVHNLSETLSVPPTKDEVAELTQTFNDITNQLDHVFMAQKRFSASAAHELRTPLAVLQTKIDVFKKKRTHSSDEYEALVRVFEKQISRLRNLVGNLLDMTNMDDDREKSTIYLQDIFEDILSELSGIAAFKHLHLSLTCDDSIIDGNVELLYRAFYNVIENAIKYNIEGGIVQIDITKTSNRHSIIQIMDSGIGIPDALKKNIFEPFYRIDKSRSREMGGAGLGLSMVDSIIKKHGGTIIVGDNGNRGTCFKITL